MRFMIIVKANEQTEAGVMPEEQRIAEMATFHEELARAGLLIDASGLKPSSNGWRIHYEGAQPTLVDGPFPETKELIAGYTIIKAKSREEAIAWSRRFPNPAGRGMPATIEVRQLFEVEDFEPSRAVDRFKALQACAIADSRSAKDVAHPKARRRGT